VPLSIWAPKAPLRPRTLPQSSPSICCTYYLFHVCSPPAKSMTPKSVPAESKIWTPYLSAPKSPPNPHQWIQGMGMTFHIMINYYMEVNSVKHNVTYCTIIATLVCVKYLEALAQTLVGEQPCHARKLRSYSTKNNQKIKGERRRDKQGEAREMKCPHLPDQVYNFAYQHISFTTTLAVAKVKLIHWDLNHVTKCNRAQRGRTGGPQDKRSWTNNS